MKESLTTSILLWEIVHPCDKEASQTSLIKRMLHRWPTFLVEKLKSTKPLSPRPGRSLPRFVCISIPTRGVLSQGWSPPCTTCWLTEEQIARVFKVSGQLNLLPLGLLICRHIIWGVGGGKGWRYVCLPDLSVLLFSTYQAKWRLISKRGADLNVPSFYDAVLAPAISGFLQRIRQTYLQGREARKEVKGPRKGKETLLHPSLGK